MKNSDNVREVNAVTFVSVLLGIGFLIGYAAARIQR